MRKPEWSWAGAAILALAICLGGGWAAAIVLSVSARTPPVNDRTSDLLSTIGGVLAASITAYVGARVGAMRERNKREVGDDEPG